MVESNVICNVCGEEMILDFLTLEYVCLGCGRILTTDEI